VLVGVFRNNNLNLHIVKVFGDNCAWTYSSGLVAAGDACNNQKSNVISMSLGSSGSTVTERTGFQNLYNAGVLSVAAAGNSGNSAYSYPASYDSVVSIAAIDSSKTVASFSQFNDQVEWSAPGVTVLSTVGMGGGDLATVNIGGNPGTLIPAYASDGSTPAFESPRGSTGYVNLCNCGTGQSLCSNCSGSICLIQRGTNTLAEKVLNCQNAGGVAAVVYNNLNGGFTGSLGTTATKIPSACISNTDGATALGQVNNRAQVVVAQDNYMYYDGTSMATPHASAVAALVWSYFPSCTNAQIRSAMASGAVPLGSPQPRNNYYGYGLVQAQATYNFISTTKMC